MKRKSSASDRWPRQNARVPCSVDLRLPAGGAAQVTSDNGCLSEVTNLILFPYRSRALAGWFAPVGRAVAAKRLRDPLHPRTLTRLGCRFGLNQPSTIVLFDATQSPDREGATDEEPAAQTADNPTPEPEVTPQGAAAERPRPRAAAPMGPRGGRCVLKWDPMRKPTSSGFRRGSLAGIDRRP
jgi:hypothetical protein